METVKKSESVVKEIPLDQIFENPTIQSRLEKSEKTIFQYSLSLAKGDQFPAIDVFEAGTGYLLVDGGHRKEAYLLEDRDTILAQIHQGGATEALIFAAGANAKHGLLRSNQDKHRVVENVLKHPELGKMSNNKIAEICAVSQPFVGRVRWQLTCNGFKFDSVRVSSNGREIQTASIGQKKLSAKPKAKPEAADASPEKVAQNGSGETTASPESISQPDGPVVDETLPQGAEGVDKVQGDGATQPDEQKYPDDPAELKRLLEQKDQMIKELLAENKNLKAENEKLKKEAGYLKDELTKDTTV